MNIAQRAEICKKTVAKYMSQRADHAELIGQELLQEILKEAGFDS